MIASSAIIVRFNNQFVSLKAAAVASTTVDDADEEQSTEDATDAKLTEEYCDVS